MPPERPQSISYVPDDLEDISEIVRHAEPVEEVPAKASSDPGPIETVSSSVNITYDADDLEIPGVHAQAGAVLKADSQAGLR